MTTPAEPLPLGQLVELTHFNGDPIKYLEHLYDKFTQDFLTTKPMFRNRVVLCDTRNENGRCSGFVHITTKENSGTQERQLDLRRCERIHWIRVIVENETHDSVLVWTKPNKKRMRVYLYAPSERFLVILEDRGSVYFLVTAYYVDGDRSHARYIAEHARETRNAS